MTSSVIPTRIVVADDRTSAAISIGKDTVIGNAAGISELIAQLGRARSDLLPAVDNHVPHDRAFVQVNHPAVEIVGHPDGVRLALRTPQFGWIGFHLTPVQALEIARHLVAMFDSAPGADR
ncbi:MAG TPA: hypothetical protein VMV45_08410 [Casimicrobiaceae bacterium]|nr:hypothetical protein [Casimicrobiaceae bacterium]